ncbi:MAG: hypothetical protein K0S54_2143 [Alphaproteobacteria bacterium]|jgi:hypothetical protein|nr:hypothetical protein [Alphaproteobacteria bacterium]
MSEQEKKPAASRPRLRVAAERRDYDNTFALDPEKPEQRAMLMTRLRHHPDAEVRYLAAAMLRGEPVLAEVALGDADPRVRRAAILHLGDADLWVLGPVLARDPDADVAMLALACVRAETPAGEALLARTVLSHPVAAIRLEALLKKRWDREALAIRLLRSEPDHDTAIKALREVRERKALQKLAETMPSAALRAAAARRVALLDEMKARDGKPPRDKA